MLASPVAVSTYCDAPIASERRVTNSPLPPFRRRTEHGMAFPGGRHVSVTASAPENTARRFVGCVGDVTVEAVAFASRTISLLIVAAVALSAESSAFTA